MLPPLCNPSKFQRAAIRDEALPSVPRDGESGQAAVEAALVLPLYVFLVLGILQLSLMHQARLLTKYAAYKAVRVGALHNARLEPMERTALAVLLPLMSRELGPSGEAQVHDRVGSAAEFQRKWGRFSTNRMPDAPLPYVQVAICNPTSDALGGREELDFDDPRVAASGEWKASDRTRLAVQVTLNYRMPIPFANWVIHRLARGQELAWDSRVQRAVIDLRRDVYWEIAGRPDGHLYVLPIRAAYSTRMQSNLYAADLPPRNECHVPFDRL